MFSKLFLIIITTFSAYISTGCCGNNEPESNLNMFNEEILPRNFRMSIDSIEGPLHLLPDLNGLADLRMSGSAQFSEESLKMMKSVIPSTKLHIIDLREESHGYINGIAISWRGKNNWANFGKTLEEINQDEKTRLSNALKEKIFTVNYKAKYQLPPFVLQVENAMTEEETVQAAKVNYLRMPVSDYCKPNDELVDEFINLVKNLSPDDWLHFHCAAGKGRTTTFMVMLDMMKNSLEVEYNDIIMRQHLLGGLNFLTPLVENEWKTPYHLERIRFIERFYQYCKENIETGFTENWSSWLARQPIS